MMFVDVVVGIVLHQNKVLIAKRPAGKFAAGLWEFPGGKVEAHETLLDALKRELAEEVALTIHHAEPHNVIEYHYENNPVRLHNFIVAEFSGEAKGLEGQAVHWATAEDLQARQFPEANIPLVEWVVGRMRKAAAS